MTTYTEQYTPLLLPYPKRLTLRMARVVRGIADVFKEELIAGKSLLLVGPPGRGKTTLLRDIAWLLSSRKIDRRVMVVDTNNEIAGETAVPHSAIGNARRLKVGAGRGSIKRCWKQFRITHLKP